MCDAVEYLGHLIDAEGLHTLSSKVKAIQDAPQPQNVQELRSFLGLLHYYGKFLPNIATLLKTGSKWLWSAECSDAFKAAKRLLVTAPVLARYNPSLPIRLVGDASAYGIGAVISHVFEDGSERPVAFASCTLSKLSSNRKGGIILNLWYPKVPPIFVWSSFCSCHRSPSTALEFQP